MTKTSSLKFLSGVTVLAVAALMGGSCNNTDSAKAATDSTATDKDGFVQIFDGKTFTGWDADTAFWRVDSGAFIGQVYPGKPPAANTFLIWRGGRPADFELKTEYRISDGGNSGIQYRSEEVPGVKYGLKGYQADIDGANTYTGQNYEERGRGFLAWRGTRTVLENGKPPILKDSVGKENELKALIKNNDWNEIYLVVKGNDMKHYINGVLMSETIDNDTANRKFDGVLGFQVHVVPSMKVEYRNIRYKKD